MIFADFFHVVNPSAPRRRAVVRFFEQHSELKSVFIERATHPTHLETVVEWAVNEGHHRLAVWGGDGTLNRVVQKLHELKALDRVEVSLVPVGTCNDFARAFQMPSWKKYAPACLSGEVASQTIDIGVMSFLADAGSIQRIFMNNAGFGREARALGEHRSSPLRDIFSFSSKRLDLDWIHKGTQSFETRDVLLGVVCNGPYFSKGLTFDGASAVDDGVLDIFLEAPRSPILLLLSFLRARFGGFLKSATTTHIQAKSLSVQSSQLLYPQADGEPIDNQGVTRLSFGLLSQPLRFVRWI